MSLALQSGAPLEHVGDLLTGATCEPCGSGHLRFMSARLTLQLRLVTGEEWAGACLEYRQRTNIQELEIIESCVCQHDAICPRSLDAR